MDINRFTDKVQQALSAAQTKAIRYGHQQIDVEHLLVALLEQKRGRGQDAWEATLAPRWRGWT